jgi:hypothetical protein
MSYFFLYEWSNSKEASELLQNVFTIVHYTCTFLVFYLGKRRNIFYHHLLKGIAVHSGTGFNNATNQRSYERREEKRRRKASEFIVDR